MSAAHERLRANDLRFLTVARSLSERDWSRRSLCSAWSNHDVLAHLVVGYRVPPRTFGIEMVRHRWSFDGSNAGLAQSLALRRTPTELMKEFTELIDRPRGVGRMFPRRLLLGDHVIHELDVVLPLGLQPTVDLSAITAVLETQIRVPNPLVPAAARARGLTLRATDADWTSQDGPLCIEGKAAHLASVLAGRPWALNQLSGDGVPQLRERL